MRAGRAEAPRGGVVEYIGDASYPFVLRNREIERFDPELDLLKSRAWDLREQLQEQVGAAIGRRLARNMMPCPRCQGVELLVSNEAVIPRISVGGGMVELHCTIAVCKNCGDVRLTASNLAELAVSPTAAGEPAFRSITVDARDKGPYR